VIKPWGLGTWHLGRVVVATEPRRLLGKRQCFKRGDLLRVVYAALQYQTVFGCRRQRFPVVRIRRTEVAFGFDVQLDGLQHSIPEDAAQKWQRDVLMQIVCDGRSLIGVPRFPIALRLHQKNWPLTVCTQHMPQVMQKRGNDRLSGFFSNLGQMSALQGML